MVDSKKQPASQNSKFQTSHSTSVKVANWLTAIILVLIPFHAFLTVWLSSLAGHYTLLRLWKEFLLLGLVVMTKWTLFRDKSLLKWFLRQKLTWFIGVYGLVQLIWGAVSYATHAVTAKALGYGLLVNLRFLIFFVVVWILASQSEWLHQNWRRLLILPATIVVIIGLLQYFVLPYDVMRHFGYTANTIFPYETINHNIHYIRVMSTLRGANPLGAYLVVILSLLVVLWKRQWKMWQLAILPAASLVVLLLTFSRGAWLGFVLSLGVVVWTILGSPRARQLGLVLATSIVVVAAGSFAVLRHNTAFQNAIFHTQDHSKVATSSNEGHRSALKSGVRDLLHEPLGRGPGTAGPASTYNAGKGRIAENYFVQIGQETGWIGLILFMAINVLVGRELWRRRADPLALGLFAALIGVSFVNLLSHAWTDDTLAYIFWGLAGVAFGKIQEVKPVHEETKP